MYLPGRSLVRVLCLICALACYYHTAIAETLSLQIPISRASHSFSLWELNSDPNDTSGYEMSSGIWELGIPGGFYQKRTITGLSLVGGSFDGNGVWNPGDGALLQGFIERTPNTTTFFISDDTASAAVHANMTAVVNSAWVPLWAPDPIAYYSIPAERSGHQFLLQAYGVDPDTSFSWYGWWSLTNSPIVSWVGVDGTNRSYGFFESWTFVPRGLQYVTVYDISAGEATIPVGSDLTTSSTVWNSIGYGYWPTTSAFIGTGNYGESYELISPYGAPQSVSAYEWNSNLNMYGVSVTVGYNQEFWLRRPSDGQTSNIWTVGWGTGNVELDASSTFAGGPISNWQYLNFRASPSRNAFGWKVRRTLTGEETPIGWGSLNGAYIYDPAGYQSAWVDWYEGWAWVDIHGGWTVVGNSGEDQGTGPDWVDWPTFYNPTAELILPSSRNGYAMSVSQTGHSLGYIGSFGTMELSDAFTGAYYTVWLDRFQLPLPWEAYAGNYVNINISVAQTGEVSPPISTTGGSSVSLTDWFPSYTILFKISATRWHHSLEVRCGNGEIFPIQKHRVQGDWSYLPSTGQSYFNSYGYFDASGETRNGIPWHVYDATSGEYLETTGSDTDFSLDSDNTDTDGDGLPDWYEHFLGTDPTDTDTDNDGVDDATELANGTNPRAISATGIPNGTLKVFTPGE
jgi:hypothetical protein